MNRPPAKTMLLGHPIVAVPLTVVGGVGLFVSLYGGVLLPASICGAVALAALRANEQAMAYRHWRAEWDGLGDSPAPRTATPERVVAVMAVAALMLLAYARPLIVAYWVGYALGWASRQHWLLAGLGVVAAAIVVQFVRYFPRRARRAKRAKPVAVIAKRVLPVPSIADAYRALPDYCQALLRGQS